MDEGFAENVNKTRVQFKHQRQEVTGLIVNESSVKISKKYKRSLKQEIYYCRKYGVSEHQRYVNEDYCFYKEHLYGKAYYIYMVEPAEGIRILDSLNEIKWDY